MDRLSRRDVRSGAALVVLAVIYFLGASSLPDGVDEPGPAFFPRLLALALFALGTHILFGGARGADAEEETTPRPRWRPTLLIGATCLYLALLPRVGFVGSTLGYAFAVAKMFGGSTASSTAVSVGATLVVYWLFTQGLSVSLP